MKETTRGHSDNAGMRSRISEMLMQNRTETQKDIVLVRLTAPEYTEVLRLPIGTRIAILNLQHYKIEPGFDEFRIRSDQFGVCIRKPGRNTREESTDPELDDTKPVISLRLEGYSTDHSPVTEIDRHSIAADYIILGSTDTAAELLRQKYEHTMPFDPGTSYYYIRIYTITDFFSLNNQDSNTG
jgi:hypothetical protein